MKPIDEMSDQEKSVTLAKLCGWKVFRSGINGELDRVTVQEKEWTWTQFDSDKLNLYDPAAMAGAWLVLNWAHVWLASDAADGKMLEWYYNIDDMLQWHLAPADAQRKWLDKILSLAIEAGLCEDTAVSQEEGE